MERIDLTTHGKQIGAACEEIRNASSSNTWVVFGYEGKSPTIIVKEKGDDWDELVDEMSASKILYAYIRVVDPNTGLNKFVLINWSGEGVPSSIKGPRAYHIPDIERLVHTKHVMINARHEDDLDEKGVKNKVAKSSGSNYSFHKEKAKAVEAVGPVGSTYKKTDAQGEITSSGRSKFWQKQDTEEHGRIQGENERLSRTRSEAERSQKERDSRESSDRNQRIDDRQRNVDSQKAQERDQLARQNEERKMREQEQFDIAGRELIQDKETAAHQIPNYRQEASNLQGSAPTPQYTPQATPPVVHSSYEEPERTPIRPPLPQEVDDSPRRDEYQPAVESDEELTYDTAQDIIAPVAPQEYDEYSQAVDPGMYDEIGDTIKGMQVQETDQQKGSEDIYDEIDTTAAAPTQAGFSVRAIYDYTAAEEGEISFDPGDVITNVDPIDEGWWQGTAPNGEYGLFPATYVEQI